MPALTIINPATGRRIRSVRVAGAQEIAQRHAAAVTAQRGWAGMPQRERLETIRRFRAAVIAEREPLARTLTAEMGKPITQSRNEIDGLLPRLDFFLQETPRVLREKTVWRDRSAGLEERITHEPLGVIANISAWNYPYFVGANVFIPALLAGNAVLYKPSEYATLTGLEIARLLHASGVPADVFVPIVGGGEAGAALLAQAVDGVAFTGSVATGRRIARRVAGRMIPLQLELGGKDPVYVCADVDVDAAAAAVADGAFYNNGQSCCAVERIYVEAPIFDAFADAFVRTVQAFRLGDPQEEDTYLGPLARRAQLDVLEAQIADALRRGARIRCGGERVRTGALRQGNYFAPTVLVDVDHRMKVMREETFGPVIGLMPVRDDEHAVALMNDTTYGLTAGVYTPDARRARALLARVEAGSAYWNCCDRVSPRLPWSGRKQSGIGVTLSPAGILAFTRPRAWHLRRG